MRGLHGLLCLRLEVGLPYTTVAPRTGLFLEGGAAWQVPMLTWALVLPLPPLASALGCCSLSVLIYEMGK